MRTLVADPATDFAALDADAFFAALRHIYLDVPFGERGLWTRLPSLGIPTLFVWGARDRLVPASLGRAVMAALPAAKSVVLTDCGHVPQFEQPEKVSRLIRDYLAVLDAHTEVAATGTGEPRESDRAG